MAEHGKRVNAVLLIDGQPVPEDCTLDVWLCDWCGGKGRRMVRTGYSFVGNGTTIWHEQEHPCGKCLRSGFVVRLSREEDA